MTLRKEIEQKLEDYSIHGVHITQDGKRIDPKKFYKTICDTAPYPECNGANGCDTCEYQPEE